MPLRLQFAALSDIGRHRGSNQDRWLVREDLPLAAVADGMGGMPHGEEAAQTAIDSLSARLETQVPADPAAWRSLLDALNHEVATLGRRLSPELGIGTTLTLAHLGAGRLTFAHVGDSALFRLRAGRLQQLTAEHTVAGQILARRAAGRWQPMPHNAAHILTSCLGQPALVETEVGEADLLAGDRLLLCTDGLTKPVQPRSIRDALALQHSPADAVRTLVDLANREGGPDNITAVVVFAE